MAESLVIGVRKLYRLGWMAVEVKLATRSLKTSNTPAYCFGSYLSGEGYGAQKATSLSHPPNDFPRYFVRLVSEAQGDRNDLENCFSAELVS